MSWWNHHGSAALAVVPIKNQLLPAKVSITNLPEDVPEFKRRYVSQITEEVTARLEAKTYSFGRHYFAELKQRNGSWVYFDPKNVADKILDRDLVPIVEEWCGAILEADDEFVRSKPIEFVDERGNTWQRLLK